MTHTTEAQSTHVLGAFINHETRQFTTTSRNRSCKNFATLILSQQERGYEYMVIAEDLPKSVGDSTKSVFIAAMRTAGYEPGPKHQMSKDFIAEAKKANRIDEVLALTAAIAKDYKLG